MINTGSQNVEELILELREPDFSDSRSAAEVSNSKKRRLSAKARLVYKSSTFSANRSVNALAEGKIAKSSYFKFVSPLGTIETEELRWYLENYHIRSVGSSDERAKSIEKKLSEWGKSLYKAVFILSYPWWMFWKRQRDSLREPADVWLKNSENQKLFSIYFDDKSGSIEAASELMALPWELLILTLQQITHGESGYTIQSKQPIQVCRRLPSKNPGIDFTKKPPIRVLLVSPRPEYNNYYLDHRANALPF